MMPPITSSRRVAPADTRRFLAAARPWTEVFSHQTSVGSGALQPQQAGGQGTPQEETMSQMGCSETSGRLGKHQRAQKVGSAASTPGAQA